MGQLITVTERIGARPGVIVFELNRSLTGMGHERFKRGDRPEGPRPVDELARRLLAETGVATIHIYSNVVTVEMASGSEGQAGGLGEIIRNLFIYYGEGDDPAEVAAEVL